MSKIKKYIDGFIEFTGFTIWLIISGLVNFIDLIVKYLNSFIDYFKYKYGKYKTRRALKSYEK